MNQNRIAVIDVETPNGNNDAICSIGIVFLEDLHIVGEEYSLIDPEEQFSDRCIAIHGITADDVSGAPTFPEYWEIIKDIFTGCLLAGHNLAFDLSCIKKALSRYGIEADPVYYLDTLHLAKRNLPELGNYKLDTLCAHFGINLESHHDAMCDSKATAELLINLIKNYNIRINYHIKKYPFINDGQQSHKNHKVEYSDTTIALRELHGVLYGIVCDSILTNEEILSLEKWLTIHSNLSGNFPYDKIYSTVADILADGIVTEPERDELLHLINNIMNPVENACADVPALIEGKLICLTGEFECMQKNELAQVLASKGGIIKPNVVKSLNYLIVGNKGSDQWSHGNYGNKVKRAMELNENGCRIKILRECEFIPGFLDE